MAKLVTKFKILNQKSGKNLGGYVEYIAKRENVEKIEQDLDVAGFGFLTADDFLGLLIEFGFAFYGDYVLKDRKSYGKLCARIVEEEFPDGISNSKEDMDLLRKLVKQQYGELDLPENDRSVFARICDYLIFIQSHQQLPPFPARSSVRSLPDRGGCPGWIHPSPSDRWSGRGF